MTEIMVAYYEDLHIRRQSNDFSVESELDFIEEKFENDDIVDAMLCFDATLNMDLDISSSKSDKRESKKHSRLIYNRIKKYRPDLGVSFLSCMDK
ncbi:MAG: hypothetical protein Unbinned6046contig1000_15 [Prokaryotic dsDNA virus sp.]|nr:MAG: hypothetical protein Unbinned6046contig1000_15 [Prokaryotic dsDNA virus sp.]|tara:strand:+ start:10671 stop:10955 length:285 start_codon:yes stop_codon:yes gene_type:complete